MQLHDFIYYDIPEYESAKRPGPRTKLIVASDNLTPQSSDLLDKIIQATGLQTDQYTHFDADSGYLPVKSIRKLTEDCHIIAFDIHPSTFGLQMVTKRYHPIKIGQITLVFVDSLETISEEKVLKAAIWKLLKKWFVDGS